MAMRSITRMYDTYDDAVNVVNALEAAGVPHADISIVSNDAKHADSAHAASSHAGAGASVGTVVGGTAGLLAGIGALAIPGVGPVVAAGWLVATLLGAGVGAAAGGIVGGLTGTGLSEREANVYGEGVRRGGSLVTVRAEEADLARATPIMDRYRPVSWEERETQYRQGGWTRYDDAAGPYTGTGTGPVSGPNDMTDADRARARAAERV